MKRTVIPALVLGLLATLSIPVLAQPAPAKAHRYKKDTDAPKVEVIKRGGRTVYRFKGLVLHGTAHRPQAVLMMDRERDLFHPATPKKELSSRILDPVRRRPF